jgi:hypothetical protein
MVRPQMVYFGNAAIDQLRGTGWFVGHFAPPGPRRHGDVELKWGVHRDGEVRARGPEAVTGATTISILIRGALRLVFDVDGAERVTTLRQEGDYVIFGPGIVHSWRALGETLVLTVRFPSIERTQSA